MNKYNSLNYNNKENKNEILRLKKENEKIRTINLLIFFLFVSTCLLPKTNKFKSISRSKELIESKIFIKKCFKGELINHNINISFANPKISTIIPAYNCEKTIKATIRSIQNQKMPEIEIIIVNDNSNDNTYNIIQKLAEEDQRIKIINNKHNMATLYSRNIGILNSKGKYIMNLDNDDLFLNLDVFEKIYKEAENGDFDIVGFKAIDSQTYNPLFTQMNEDPLHNQKDGLIVHQPQLTYFCISSNNKIKTNDPHVWGRLTKAELYLKAINNFGKNAIGEIRNLCFVTWAEDCAMSMAIFRYAKSYKFIQKYGIFHFLGKKTSSVNSKNELRKYGELFFLDCIFDFTHNTFNGKKFSVKMAKNMIFAHINDLYSEKNKIYLKAILQKMLNCEYISFEDKNEINKILDILNGKIIL